MTLQSGRSFSEPDASGHDAGEQIAAAMNPCAPTTAITPLLMRELIRKAKTVSRDG
jgi:hypothetical protein